MADMEKFKRHFRHIWDCEVIHPIFSDKVCEIVEKTVEMVEQERRWIPVSERLPEERINPLTKDFDTVICLCNFVDATDVRMYQFGNGHFYHWGMEMKCVTHWMYKPQPPKDGDPG